MAGTAAIDESAQGLSPADFVTLMLTFFSLGVTVQVILIDAGTSAWRALVASSVIFSATSQLAYLAVRDAGGTEFAAIAAGWVVASRFGILAVSLGQKLPPGRPMRVLAAVNSFDPNVGIAVQQKSPNDVQREFWKTTASMMIGWFVGIGVGTFLGDVLGDTTRFGLDTLFPAALLAIIGNLLRTRDGLISGTAGGVVCLALVPFTPAGVPIILSVVGVAVALWSRRFVGPS